jgi:hypothetical protein
LGGRRRSKQNTFAVSNDNDVRFTKSVNRDEQNFNSQYFFKNRLLMKKQFRFYFLWFILSIFCLQGGTAQNSFLVKGGLGVSNLFGWQESEFMGGYLGIEKQLGRYTAISTTFGYLFPLNPTPTEADILSDLGYYQKNERFITNLKSIEAEIRVYPQSDLKGFFLGLGLKIAAYQSNKIVIEQLYHPQGDIHRYLKSIHTETETSVMPNVSLGYAFPLSERFFLELGGDVSAKVSGSAFGLTSLAMRLKYEF